MVSALAAPLFATGVARQGIMVPAGTLRAQKVAFAALSLFVLLAFMVLAMPVEGGAVWQAGSGVEVAALFAAVLGGRINCPSGPGAVPVGGLHPFPFSGSSIAEVEGVQVAANETGFWFRPWDETWPATFQAYLGGDGASDPHIQVDSLPDGSFAVAARYRQGSTVVDFSVWENGALVSNRSDVLAPHPVATSLTGATLSIVPSGSESALPALLLYEGGPPTAVILSPTAVSNSLIASALFPNGDLAVFWLCNGSVVCGTIVKGQTPGPTAVVGSSGSSSLSCAVINEGKAIVAAWVDRAIQQVIFQVFQPDLSEITVPATVVDSCLEDQKQVIVELFQDGFIIKVDGHAYVYDGACDQVAFRVAVDGGSLATIPPNRFAVGGFSNGTIWSGFYVVALPPIILDPITEELTVMVGDIFNTTVTVFDRALLWGGSIGATVDSQWLAVALQGNVSANGTVIFGLAGSPAPSDRGRSNVTFVVENIAGGDSTTFLMTVMGLPLLANSPPNINATLGDPPFSVTLPDDTFVSFYGDEMTLVSNSTFFGLTFFPGNWSFFVDPLFINGIRAVPVFLTATTAFGDVANTSFSIQTFPPTVVPTTDAPTLEPTAGPTISPTAVPTTSSPTLAPTTSSPTTQAPTLPPGMSKIGLGFLVAVPSAFILVLAALAYYKQDKIKAWWSQRQSQLNDPVNIN